MITEVSPARLFAAALKSAALAPVSETAAWAVKYGVGIPAEPPINRLAVMNASPLTHFKDPAGNLVQHFGAQVLLRSDKQEAGYLKALAVVERMVRAKPADPVGMTITVTPGNDVNYRITHCTLASGPIYLGTEEKYTAHLHSVNFLFTVEYA